VVGFKTVFLPNFNLYINNFKKKKKKKKKKNVLLKQNYHV